MPYDARRRYENLFFHPKKTPTHGVYWRAAASGQSSPDRIVQYSTQGSIILIGTIK